MIFAALALTLAFASVEVPVIGLDELEERFEQGGDTVFVVNFWATWCKPCIAEVPAFDEFHRSMAGEPVRVIMVSLDDPEDVHSKVEAFIKRKGLEPDFVLLDESKPHLWIDRVDETWSGAIPATLLLDAASGRRLFLEREFTFEELSKTVEIFRKASR